VTSAPSPEGTDRSGRIGRLLQRAPASANPPPSAVDPLSGLPNRDALLGLVNQASTTSNASSARALVAFIDIGLLRDVNDSFGPDVGDELIRQVGRRLASIDLPGTSVVRYGGAEFAAVFQQITKPEHPEEIARFLVELLSQPFELGEQKMSIDPTLGLALSADTHIAPSDVIRDAHQALVRSRDEGRGSFLIYDDSRKGRYETRVDERRLRDALDNDEFFLAYQPIVRMDTAEIVGVEALLRWKAPGSTNSGTIFPQDFLPLLEKSGLGIRAGEVVLNKACQQVAAWNLAAPSRPRLFVSANLGARQLAERGFPQTVVAALERASLPPEQLCLDITEDALRYNRSGTWGALRDLKNWGVKLGIDDFGTGTASLAWLRELELDILRIDRIFTSGLGSALQGGFGLESTDAVLIRHMAAMAHDLGFLSVAEGVEQPAEAEALAELGVDLGQGFLFSRPVPADAITATIAPESVTPSGEWDTSNVLGAG